MIGLPLPSSLNTQTLLPGSSSATSHRSLQHLLLNLHLLGTQLKVMLNGGKFKQQELIASPVSVDSQLSICHAIYNASEHLPPDWVSQKHPNPMHNNGLFFVIEAQHCQISYKCNGNQNWCVVLSPSSSSSAYPGTAFFFS